MLTLKNSTGQVVVVYNKYFSKDIVLDQVVTIDDDELMGDYELHLKYFSTRKMKTFFDTEEVRSRVGGKHDSWYLGMNYPSISVVNVKGFTELELKNDHLIYMNLYLFFMNTTLLRVGAYSGKTKLEYVSGSFLKKKDKKVFSILALIETMISSLIGLLYLFALLFGGKELYAEAIDLGEKIIFFIMSFYILGVPIANIYHYRITRKWDVVEEQ